LENHSRAPVWRLAADDHGRFSLGRLPAGGYVVRAVAGDLHALAGTTLEPGGPAGELRLVLSPTRLVGGRLLDAEGHALSGAWVHAIARGAQAGPAPLYRLFPAPTDAQGRFVFPLLAVDTWRFLARLRGEVAVLSAPVAPDADEALLKAGPPATLALRLLEPGGTPAARAAVRATDALVGMEAHRAIADAYGVVRFTDLRAADYVLHVESARFAMPPAEATRSALPEANPPAAPVTADAVSTEQPSITAPTPDVPTVTLEIVATLRGRVLHADTERGLAGMPVWLASDPGTVAMTDASGYYRLGPAPPGPCEVRVGRPRGFAVLGPDRHAAMLVAEEVAVGPDFTLKPGVGLWGRVLDAADRPAPDANVFVSFRGDAQADWGTRTGPDGTFYLDGFWHDNGLRVWAEHLDTVSLGAGPLEIFEEDVRGVSLSLRLPRSGAILGRVVNADGSGTGGARIWCHAPDPSLRAPLHVNADPSGMFEIEGLIPGVYRLAAAGPGDAGPGPEVVIELAPGQRGPLVTLPRAQ
jgi:hypothetical protein